MPYKDMPLLGKSNLVSWRKSTYKSSWMLAAYMGCFSRKLISQKQNRVLFQLLWSTTTRHSKKNGLGILSTMAMISRTGTPRCTFGTLLSSTTIECLVLPHISCWTMTRVSLCITSGLYEVFHRHMFTFNYMHGN